MRAEPADGPARDADEEEVLLRLLQNLNSVREYARHSPRRYNRLHASWGNRAC